MDSRIGRYGVLYANYLEIISPSAQSSVPSVVTSGTDPALMLSMVTSIVVLLSLTTLLTSETEGEMDGDGGEEEVKEEGEGEEEVKEEGEEEGKEEIDEEALTAEAEDAEVRTGVDTSTVSIATAAVSTFFEPFISLFR